MIIKQHFQMHIFASRFEYKTGKSLLLSKDALLKLKKGIQNYQQEKFPELSGSVVRHGGDDKSNTSEKEYQFKLRTGRESDREHLSAVILGCYKKARSIDNFLKLLRENNLITYERSGKTTGIIFNGKKFRFKGLGFTQEQFRGLERVSERENSLSENRKAELEKSKMDQNR